MANEIQSIAADHIPIVSGDIIEALENSMKTKLRSGSPLSAKCCIFRVPKVLRRHKPEAYEPDVVSIGPFHQGGKQFELMENVKQWYLHNFLSLLDISLKTLIQSIDNIIDYEKRAREFFAEPLYHLSQNALMEIMIFDGCFLIELFLKNYIGEPNVENDNDTILKMNCMLQYLCHDLLLLENQLPWFVLQYLHSLVVDRFPDLPPLKKLVLGFFRLYSVACTFELYLKQKLDLYDGAILHILDLTRTAIVFQFNESYTIYGEGELPPATTCSEEISKFTESKFPPATTLSEAGVKFRGVSDDCILNVNFKDGILTIPQLAIAESTQPLLRNLIAFEQCYHSHSYKILSYAIFMNNLIDSSKDVDFLYENEIIYNWFSSENASQLFKNLYNDTVIADFYYERLCTEVNKYYNRSWNRWPEKLKRDYFSNPWTITSLVAAFILLALTLLPTAYTIHQYYHPRH